MLADVPLPPAAMCRPPRLILLAALLALLAGCDLLHPGDNPPWDTDIPTSEAFDAELADWSPDGTRIIFQHTPPYDSDHPEPSNQLWVADLTTGERRAVFIAPVLNVDWSPDGQWFVFHAPTDPEQLYKLSAAGGEAMALTGPYSSNPDLQYAAVGRWSPDSQRLLFTIAAGEPRGITIMNADGSDPKIIVPYGIHGSWFPDGERIAYVNWDQDQPQGDRREIYTARADGSDVQRLTSLPFDANPANVAVSPDGQMIAFTNRGENGGAQLFLMNADGSDLRQVTDGEGLVVRPEWHPSGARILFTRWQPNISQRLYLLDVATLEVVPVFPAAE